MNKKVAALVAVGTVGILGITSGAMASATTEPESGSGSLISRLVERFNLNESEVQAVFDEEKEARKAERSARASERLQEAVDSGDITAEQKTAIEAKMVEIEAERDSQRTALETWASENGVDAKYLMGRGPGGSTRLDEAVEDGSITEEQKTLIENKQAELETDRQQKRDTLKQWAEENDIDEQYLMGGMMGGRGHGPGSGMR